MKAKLILKRYNGCYALNDYREPSKGYPLVIAHSGDENFRYKLSTKNCDEIFGVVDVEKLAEESWGDKISSSYHAYIEGFNKAMELNKDKVFTLEDVKKSIEMAREENGLSDNTMSYDYSEDEIIQSLQQPSEIEVEIVMKPYTEVSEGWILDKKEEPKLDENGCLILTKKQIK